MTSPLPEFLDVGDGAETIVFLHGLGGDKSNWQPQIDEFSTDYRCVAWTFPGYGSSPAVDLNWPKLASEVIRLLDAIDVDRAHLIGLSMGGYIAQQFAADYPERVGQLVLAATSAQFGRGSASFAEKFLAIRLKPIEEGATPADFAAMVVQNLLSPDASPDAVSNGVASMSRISSDAYRRTLTCLITWDFIDQLARIEAPTLCLAGADDKTAPVAALAALADGIAGAKLAVLESCQHLMNLDRPVEFNEQVRLFLTDS